MLLTSKQRPIYNPQRGLEVTCRFLRFHYVPNGTKRIVYHLDFVSHYNENKKTQNFEIYFVKKKSGTYISLANKHKMFANLQNVTH